MYSTVVTAFRDPKYSRLFAPLIWLADAVLCLAIVWKVPYTEIDWTAYMEQIFLILNGERDYNNIRGGTGPLVYPAGHVKIFSILYDFTEGGTDLVAAQHIFVGLYLITLAVVLTIYVKAKVPPYLLPLLILSKRLHSIYMLRMFNDCFSTLFALLAVLILQMNHTTLSSTAKTSMAALLFSLAVSVKMNALLYLPGAAIIFLYNLGSVWGCLALLAIPFLAPQVILALPFLEVAPKSYLSKAFEFSRVFLFKWTVNWRFVPEHVFLSKTFAAGLLICHLALVVLFVCKPHQRWLAGFSEKSLYEFVRNAFSMEGLHPVAVRNYSGYVAQTIALSNLIGVLCARSLHYQFYCWFYWSVPLLLHTSAMPAPICFVVWFLQEYAWNVYPSTPLSSAICILTLALTVLNNWLVVEPSKPESKKE